MGTGRLSCPADAGLTTAPKQVETDPDPPGQEARARGCFSLRWGRERPQGFQLLPCLSGTVHLWVCPWVHPWGREAGPGGGPLGRLGGHGSVVTVKHLIGKTLHFMLRAIHLHSP